MSKENTFHLAITMAGAVSAGAYTAGVMDYLLEVLDEWEKLKISGTYENKLPSHRIQIEVLSGASAGGMTACVSSILLHQLEKHHVKYETNESDRKKNRLYNSWVNLGHGTESMSGNKAISELLGDGDIKEINEYKKKLTKEDKEMIEFPVSFFNSSIIREIAKEATKLDVDDKNKIKSYGLPKYIASDFETFVTLTSLKGFKKTTSLQKQTTGGYNATYSIVDHRDVMVFNFGKENKKEGVINVDLPTETNKTEGLTLLQNAAVSTGAFPIGLEYGFIQRKTEYINKNFLMNQMHKRNKGEDIVSGNIYSSAMIDGGLINNEPFELTEILLEKRMEKCYESLRKTGRKRRYSMLLIDPFPSESVEISTNNSDEPDYVQKLNDQYPFSFVGAIGQLISVARTQLLVKSLFREEDSLIEDAFDENEINTFLISPRRYDYESDKIADGSKAIACGTLGGFGGFLDKTFREHDFFLGRNNCKSFLQTHFKFNAKELYDEKSPFYGSYSEEAVKVFAIENKNSNKDNELWLPILPDVNILINDETKEQNVIKALYRANEYPKMTEDDFETLFDNLEPQIMKRLDTVLDTFIKGKYGIFENIFIGGFNLIDKLTGKNYLLGGVKDYICKNLKDWKIIR
jgi:hypothetical protein